MLGLEIISQTPIMDTPEYIYNIFIFFVIVLVLMLAIGKYYNYKVERKLMPIMITVGLVSLIFETMFITGLFNKPTGKYTYKVTVSEDAGYRTLVKNFNIISIDGDVYTIENK